MRSGTSFFNGTVFKKTVTRFWPLWAAYFVLWVIFLPLEGLMMLRLESETVSGYPLRFAQEVASQTDRVVILAVIFGVLAAMAAFSHLYSAWSANLFGSLPVRREGLFLTHYLAGLSFMIVPNAVIFVLTLLVELAGGSVKMEALLFWLAVSCGTCFLFYSMAVFCAMFTGHILALPAFYGILNVFVFGVTVLLRTVLSRFYYGFVGFPTEVSEVAEIFTPVMTLLRGVNGSWQWRGDPAEYVDRSQFTFVCWGLGAVGIYALAALALTAAAFFLYRARRLESAGDVVSIQPMKPVFKYGVALCVGMVFGVGTMYFVNGREFGLMAAILIWGVAGYFAAQMLLDKSFRVFKKWKGAVAVAGVFVALFLVVGLDLTGYETRIPDAADVQSVYVDGLSGVNFDDNGDQVWLDITDPGQIELLITLHQTAVNQRERHPGGACINTRLYLTYTLKNGSTMRRAYYVYLLPSEADQAGTGAWALEQLYHDPGLCWRVYEFDVLEDQIARGGRLDSVMFEHEVKRDEYGWENVGDVVGYGGDARALLDAVEEDVLAGRIGVRTVTDPRATQGGDPMDKLVFLVNDPEGKGRSYRVRIALQDTATSTLAELRRLEANLDNEQIRGAFEDWLK